MRSDDDVYTDELPGIPKAPKKRSNAMIRRREADYHGPKTRPRCEGCRSHVVKVIRPGSPNESENLHCGKHDFPVHRGGICRDWSGKAGRTR